MATQKEALTEAEKKARKAEADRRYREKKKAEKEAAAAASTATTATIEPVEAQETPEPVIAPKKARKAKPATEATDTKAEKALLEDVEIVLTDPLRIFFSKKMEEAKSQLLKPGKQVKLEDTGKTHVTEDGRTVKVFRFRRGTKRVYYAVDPK